MFKKMNSKFPGKCGLCGGPFKAGTPIMYEKGSTPAHESCFSGPFAVASVPTPVPAPLVETWSEPELPLTIAEPDVVQIPEDYKGNIYELPEIQNLLKQIGEAAEAVKVFKGAFDIVDETKKDLTKTFAINKTAQMEEFERIRRAMEDAQLKYNQKMRSLQDEYWMIQAKMKQAEFVLSSLKNKLGQSIELAMAAQTLDELRAKWVTVVKQTPFKDRIRPFQIDGTIFQVEGRRTLLGDEMGLGKTGQAVCALYLSDTEYQKKQDTAVLWVCPKSVVQTTIEEIKNWTPDRPVVPLIGGPEQRKILVQLVQQQGATLIINYEALQSTPCILEDYIWPRVVLDEAHTFRTAGTKVFKNIEKLTNDAECVFALTGTPINNKPEDLWAILHMLDPIQFKSIYKFINEYCYSAKDPSTGKFRPGAYDELIKVCSHMILRRTKKDVELQLPDKTREVREIELGEEQRKLYDEMRDRFAVWLDDQHEDKLETTNVLSQFMRLRQFALWPRAAVLHKTDPLTGEQEDVQIELAESAKIDECMDIIRELVENGQKAVVFSAQNDALKEVQRRVRDMDRTCELIIGGLQPLKVASIIDEFNNPIGTDVLAGNLKAMGVGLNLQAASHGIFLDEWWNPATNAQAEDRLHRMGQKSAVTIHVLRAESTIDMYIAEILNEKKDMSGAILNREELRKALKEGKI